VACSIKVAAKNRQFNAGGICESTAFVLLLSELEVRICTYVYIWIFQNILSGVLLYFYICKGTVWHEWIDLRVRLVFCTIGLAFVRSSTALYFIFHLSLE
jgi:hypothetical protein